MLDTMHTKLAGLWGNLCAWSDMNHAAVSRIN